MNDSIGRFDIGFHHFSVIDVELLIFGRKLQGTATMGTAVFKFLAFLALTFPEMTW